MRGLQLIMPYESASVMRFFCGLAGCLMLAAGGMASADEPVRLDNKTMDAVTAGAWNGVAIAFTTNGSAAGQVINFSELSQTSTKSTTTVVGGVTTSNFKSSASSQLTAQAMGSGTSSSSGGGGVYTTVYK